MRLIDADAIVLEYGGIAHISPCDFRGTAEYFAKQIMAMPTVNQWVPCSERLPDKGLRVLMQLNNAWQIVGWYDKEDSQWFEVMYAEPVANDRVLAWMELPPSYKAD